MDLEVTSKRLTSTGLPALVIIVSVLGAAVLSATPALAATANSTTSSQALNSGSYANGWLALVVIVAGAGLGIALILLVSRDRKQSRAATLEALRAGVTSVSESATDLGGLRMMELVEVDSITVEADHEAIEVGDRAVLTAKYKGSPQPCTWTFAPTGVVSASGEGPNSSMVVTGLKAGSVTVTATPKNPPTGIPSTSANKQLTVIASKGSSMNFSILGAGLGTAILAIVAVSGAIALALRGDFTAEIGTLLGTALGAGAAGTVSAVHGASNSTQTSTNTSSKPPSGGGS